MEGGRIFGAWWRQRQPNRRGAPDAPLKLEVDKVAGGGAAEEEEADVEQGGEGPADDAPGAEVDDDGQIEPTGGGGNTGNVSRPDLVGLGREGLVGQQVGRGAVKLPSNLRAG